MSNNINSLGGAPQPTPDELNIAKSQKDQQQQAYLVSSELQFMISSLQSMAAQLQNRIREAKQAKAEDGSDQAAVGVPSSSPQSLPVSALADLSKFPPNEAGFAESFIMNPSLTEARTSLLLSSTNLDNSVQQLAGLAAPLKSALASNVNPSSMQESLQKLLPSAQSAINQLQAGRETLAKQPLHPSLEPLRKNLLSASDTLLKHITPAPESTADLPAFSLKMTDMVENQTSALQQMHLQHQKTANHVGGDLKMVLPQSNMQGAAPVAPQGGLGGAGPARGLGGAASPNPWSGVWKWLLGSQGLMANIGSKMIELTKLLKYQSNAMKDFSGMLTLFADLANWGIPSHFNPSLAHNDKTGFAQFQVAIKALQYHWATLVGGKTPKGKETIKPSQALFYKVREDMKALKQYGMGKPPKIPGLYSLIKGMEKNFYNMYNNMNAIRHMGPPDFVTKTVKQGTGINEKTVTYIKMASNPSISIWVDKKTPNGYTWVKASIKIKLNALFTNGTGKPMPVGGASMKWSEFQKYQRGVFTKFNYNQNKFQQIAKDGGSNIQSLQTSTQSQVKLYMLYYQQIMQTAPSIVQTLAQLIMAVSANFKGGQ